MGKRVAMQTGYSMGTVVRSGRQRRMAQRICSGRSSFSVASRTKPRSMTQDLAILKHISHIYGSGARAGHTEEIILSLETSMSISM